MMRTSGVRNLVRRVAVVAIGPALVLALVAAGCGDQTGDAGQADEPDPAPASAPDLTGLRAITTEALGGLRLGVDPEVAVVHEADLVQVRHPEGSGRVIIARATSTSTGAQLTTVDDLLAAADTAGLAAPEATGDSLQVLGVDLEEYAFRDPAEQVDSRLFLSAAPGMASNMAWAPLPVADLYLGEAAGGVLVAGVVANDESSLPALHRLLDEVLPTLSLTGPEMVPVATAIPEGFVPLGQPDPVTPRSVPDGLTQLFSPIEPGTYDLANLGLGTELTLEGGWFVAPNFPGFVVLADLTAGQAAGPADHDLVFVHGITGLHRLDPTRSAAAEPVPLQTPEEWEAFLATPPAGLVVTSSEATTLGGLPAMHFALGVDPEATCQPDQPCTFAFSPAINDFVVFVRSGYTGQFWWVADAPNGGLLVASQAPAGAADWLDGRPADLLSTLQFDQ